MKWCYLCRQERPNAEFSGRTVGHCNACAKYHSYLVRRRRVCREQGKEVIREEMEDLRLRLGLLKKVLREKR